VDSGLGIWGAHDLVGHGDSLDPQLMQDLMDENPYVMECYNKRPYELGRIVSLRKLEIASSS
jgi:hypothetical protein